MRYYKLINESLNKLTEVNNDSDSLSLQSLNKEEIKDVVINRIAKELKKDWRNVILIDNIIYTIEENFEKLNENPLPGGDDWVDIDLGIFSIYEFKEDKVLDHNTKLETVKEIDKIGKVPFTYFTNGQYTTYNSIEGFMSWYDEVYGRKTFSSKKDMLDYFEEDNKLKEDLDIANAFIKKGDEFIVTDVFKNFVKSAIDSNTGNRGYLFSHLYSFDVVDYKNALNKEWKIVPQKLKPQSDYNVNASRDNGFNFNYALYVDGVHFDFVSSQLLDDFGAPNYMLEAEGEEDNLKIFSPDEMVKYFKDNPEEKPLEVLGPNLFDKYKYLIPEDDFQKMYDMLGSWDGIKKIPEAVKYIKEFFIFEFNRINRNASRFKMAFEDINSSNFNNLSDDFVRGLFEGTGVYEFFSYDLSDTDVSTYDIDKINEKNIRKLNELGISKEDLKKLVDTGKFDESHPMVEESYNLLKHLKVAVAEGVAVGSESEAFKDFEKKFKDSLPDGAYFDYQRSDGDYRYIEVYPSFFDNIDNLGVLWENMYNSYDIDSAIKDSTIELFNEEFYMPDNIDYYDFNEESFNYRLSDELDEFEQNIKKEK
jgi:hypothetical protein